MAKVKLSKEELSWSLYDVANSAYILMATAVIPIFLKSMGESAGYNTFQVTSHWGLVQSAGTFVVALLSPVMGAMADYRGKKKKFFNFFFFIGIFSLFAMAFTENYYLVLVANLIAALGYSGANNFYDSFLMDVTNDDRMDYISSLGYGLGYVGSCIPFILCIYLILADPFKMGAGSMVKISLIITAIWWLVLTIPMQKNVKQRFGLDSVPRNIVVSSFKSVWATMKKLCRDKKIGLFLLSYFFYIDGVDTIIKMSTSFGADVGIPDSQLILALLVTQIVAFPAVMIMAGFSQRFSTKSIIMFSIVIYIGICIFGYFLSTAWQFWVLAVCVGIVQGTIQALSRSYYGRIIPKDNSNEYFGFYNILGKYAAIMGPLLMSVITAITGNSRHGVLSIAALFIVGLIIFSRLPDIGSQLQQENTI